jgi:hypothetical protein
MSTVHFILDSLWPSPVPQYVCQHCCALLTDAPFDPQTRAARCPVCAVVYVPTAAYAAEEVGTYLQAHGLALRFQDGLGHSSQLAILAACARGFRAAPHAAAAGYAYPPLRVILEALHHAQQFVHFRTAGLSPQLLGALKLTALRIGVRGLVWGGDAGLPDDLQRLDEAPRLQIRLGPLLEQEVNPQPLIVVDGLLAFTGAADLTVAGLHQAAAAPDRFLVVTDVPEVVQLHNHLISPTWATQSRGTSIVMHPALSG